ncbi:MAG: 8-oxoguanine DNA glycosylase [Hungatella sp.]|nr:8-oxoguanine DNA glycosylase [Hungatella sp.]
MVEVKNTRLNLGQICRSGQCFRMEHLEEEAGAEHYGLSSGDRYRLMAGSRYLELSQNQDKVFFECSQEEFDDFWKNYFDLDADYEEYVSRIDPRDSYLAGAAEFGFGIRILRQELWEMMVSFLISQQNNITRIRRCIDNICRAYGEEIVTEKGVVYHGFPSPEALASLNEDDLMACNLGYRSKYVVRAAKSTVSGERNLEDIKRMTYPRARAELMKFFGVGEKVADCICLFGLHHLDAFPIDTHIHQVLKAHYKKGFPKRRYKGCRGVLQQYLFYYSLFHTL